MWKLLNVPLKLCVQLHAFLHEINFLGLFRKKKFDELNITYCITLLAEKFETTKWFQYEDLIELRIERELARCVMMILVVDERVILKNEFDTVLSDKEQKYSHLDRNNFNQFSERYFRLFSYKFRIPVHE